MIDYGTPILDNISIPNLEITLNDQFRRNRQNTLL